MLKLFRGMLGVCLGCVIFVAAGMHVSAEENRILPGI